MSRKSNFFSILFSTLLIVAVLWFFAEVDIVGASLNLAADGLDCVMQHVEMPDTVRWFGARAVEAATPPPPRDCFYGLHAFIN